MTGTGRPRGTGSDQRRDSGLLRAALRDQGWTDHPHARSCPGCGEDARTSAIVSLAYAFESCSCDRVDYAHLVERLWHIKCLREFAGALHERDMLRRAVYALERYKRGRSLANEIKALLDEPVEVSDDRA